MLGLDFIQSFSKFARQINLRYWVVGSCAMQFHGILLEPNDLDLCVLGDKKEFNLISYWLKKNHFYFEDRSSIEWKRLRVLYGNQIEIFVREDYLTKEISTRIVDIDGFPIISKEDLILERKRWRHKDPNKEERISLNDLMARLGIKSI